MMRPPERRKITGASVIRIIEFLKGLAFGTQSAFLIIT